MKKNIVLFLCAAMLISSLCGCGIIVKEREPSPSPSDDVVSPPPSASDPLGNEDGEDTVGFLEALDMEKGYAAFTPETVMMKANGKDISWARCFYLINYYSAYIDSNVSSFQGWDTQISQSQDLTYADYVKNGIEDWVVTSSALEKGAAELDYELNDEDKAEIDKQLEEVKSSYESEEAFQEELKDIFYSEALLREDIALSYLSNKIFNEMYGEKGEKLTDEQVAEYTAKDGYMRAKHILIMTTETDENGTRVPLSEEKVAEAKAKAEEILQNLNDYDGDDFEGYFTELMNENSADSGGLELYPDGYLFQENQMVKEFENAWKSLKDGEISGLVKTDYGYHIVYRLPINYDEVPYSQVNSLYYGSRDNTLRYITAQNMYNSIIENWTNSVNVEYTDNYKNLNFTDLLVK